jgi:outer membrane protein assembly factor BamB
MKMKRLSLLLVFAALGLFLSACGSAPIASWPGISYDEARQQVYVAYGQHAYALQAENGLQRWRFPVEPQGAFTTFAAPHLTEDGQLLLGGYDNILYSVNAENGAQNWVFSGASSRYIAPPLAVGEKIFAPNSNHVLYILNKQGSLERTFGTGEPLWGQPAFSEGAVYLTSMDHSLYALDAESGTELWSADLGGTIIGSPVVDSGSIYVGTLDSTVVSLSADGRTQWTFTTQGWVWAPPLVVDGQVFVGDLDGVFYAIDAANGRELWRVETNDAITGSAALFDDSLYLVNEGGSLLSISFDGRSRQVPLPETYAGPLYGQPVVAGDLLIVGLLNNESIAIALDTEGAVVWAFSPQN